jgi:sugar/nucleoside kinase (ribokinase family)
LGHVLEEVIRFPDREVGPVLGGPAAYASVAASRLGTQTAIVTFIADGLPGLVVGPLADAHVDLDGVRPSRVTRQTVLTYDAEGNKTVTYLAVPPVIASADVPLAYWQAKAFLFCPMDFELEDDIFDRAKATGAVVMIDLGGYGGTVATRHPVDSPDVEGRVRRAVDGADIVKASLEDCRFLFGPAESAIGCSERLSNWGCRIAVVTLGEDGALIREADEPRVREIGAFPTVPVDVTGAGDVFCGALAAELLRTRDPVESTRYGCAAAALAIRRTGGVSIDRMPTDVMVRDLMSRST